MKIEYGLLRQFARERGDVKAYAPKGEVVILKDGTGDLFSIVDEATSFVFDGNEYTREQFEKLLSEFQKKSK